MESAEDFELGTPCRFIHNEREVSGEIVLRNDKRCVNLYRDSNYSGGGERIVNPDWSKVKTLYSDNHPTNINVPY